MIEAVVLGDGGPRHVERGALAQAGANVNFPDRNGMTPLHLAQGNGYRDIVTVLQQFGAQ